MIKLSILFRKPADASAFEDKFSHHVQLIVAMPNVQRTAVSRSVGSPRGEAPYYLIHEIYFADMPSATYALNSPEGRAAGGDLLTWARDTSTLMFSEVWGEDMVTRDEMNKQIDATRSSALEELDKKLEAARDEGRAEVRAHWDASLPPADPAPAPEPLTAAEGFDLSFSQFAPPKKEIPEVTPDTEIVADSSSAQKPYTIDDILAIAKGESQLQPVNTTSNDSANPKSEA